MVGFVTAVAAELVAALLAAPPPSVVQWTIRTDRRDEGLVQFVREFLPQAQAELEARLGLRMRGPGTLILFGTAERFRRATPGVDHRHTLGVARPAEKVIFVNCEAIEAQRYDDLAVTLRHELSHVIVGETVRRGGRRLPLWFDEGVAVWSSGKLPLYDARAVAAGTLRPLASLEDVFPSDPVERVVAYEQSESFVRFVVEHHGEQAIREILRAAAAGVDFETAFAEAVGADVATVERRWLRAQRPGFPWLSWVLNTFTLFTAMSLLAVFSFWIYLRRRRRKYQEWEMDESFHGEGNPWQ